MTIYLDNMAATPVDPRVADHHRAAMTENPANPNSSEHALGIKSQEAIDQAGRTLVRAVGAESEHVLFTPGASAALWIAVEDAIGRASGRLARVVATEVEHPALLAALRRAEADGRLTLSLIGVDEDGAPRLELAENALKDGADLLCTMAANNEVGTISDIGGLSALAVRFGARHLVDASQAAGRTDMSAALGADLIVVSGAKAYGPRRAGVLIGKLSGHASRLAHDVFGTPDAPSALALAFAFSLRATESRADEARIATMRDALQSVLMAHVPGLRVNGALASRLPGSLHVSTPHLPGEAAIGRLWGKIALSSGAACQSGVPGPSHVLSAMAIPDWAREGAIRIGIGRFNTEDEIAQAGEMIAAALNAGTPSRRYA
ncbi:aminotransferase class V-fold PLP-dependent enzyme [Sphingomonas sp. NIBR02145]|uniref:cysteine desulfurase family protein n=1 Tax=Sphingomonas sp. NIBR02145 TaxID=3014784 RepID=UPI0022B55EE0|nr:aminotransferase class V-fold PLP-dependent enzyme [Sphingomonas sp. NIBR02145]WHU04276.1 aminotransferase class V-fold PLP-dependent enzyme [Sphingomonas sp. NIBR02145]